MRRAVVLGRGGAGKSVLARRIGEVTGLPVTELDELFWSAVLQATPRPPPRGQPSGALTTAETGVLDGDLGPYDSLQHRLAAADTVIILDFGVARCAWRAPAPVQGASRLLAVPPRLEASSPIGDDRRRPTAGPRRWPAPSEHTLPGRRVPRHNRNLRRPRLSCRQAVGVRTAADAAGCLGGSDCLREEAVPPLASGGRHRCLGRRSAHRAESGPADRGGRGGLDHGGRHSLLVRWQRRHEPDRRPDPRGVVGPCRMTIIT